MNRVGYCCISVGVNEGRKKKDFIMVNRGMIKKTFIDKGLVYVSELIELNLNDTLKILKYNISKNIYVYRLSSDSFPWMSEYKFSELPNFETIKLKLLEIGNFIKDNNLRCGFHPGPFNVLSSENTKVVDNTINELNKHAEILDMMGLDISTQYSINIHVGSTKPTLEASAKRFCENFERLSNSCKLRLVVENDDSPTQFSVRNLYDMVYNVINIPITVDSLHYQCHTGDMNWEDTLRLGVSTWKTKPLCHHSSSRKLNEDSTTRLTAHADYLYERFDTLDLDIDIELECKQKDIAAIKYIKDFLF